MFSVATSDAHRAFHGSRRAGDSLARARPPTGQGRQHRAPVKNAARNDPEHLPSPLLDLAAEWSVHSGFLSPSSRQTGNPLRRAHRTRLVTDLGSTRTASPADISRVGVTQTRQSSGARYPSTTSATDQLSRVPTSVSTPEHGACALPISASLIAQTRTRLRTPDTARSTSTSGVRCRRS